MRIFVLFDPIRWIRCYHSGPEWIWEYCQWRCSPHSPKLQHHWNSSSDCFMSYPGHLLGRGVTALYRDAVGVLDGPRKMGKQFFLYTQFRGAFNNFPNIFVQAFEIVVDSWTFSMLLLYRWLTNFYDFRFKWTATAGIGIHSTKAWLSQLVNSKLQSGREDTLEEQYAIKFCFKLGKNITETYGMLQTAFGGSCMNRASVFELHKRFK